MNNRIKNSLKWLYPGMKVKRWLLLTPIGLLLLIVGVTLLWNVAVIDYLDNFARFVAIKSDGKVNIAKLKVYLPVSIASIIIGLVLIFVSFRQVIDSITSVVSPTDKYRLAEVIYQHRYLEQGYKVVVIGGGTGLSMLLRGLKHFTSNLSAIVTVTDDGGSSGKLIKQLGILPPGDIRNCVVALASEETLMTELFQYRFESADVGLEGHSFGNLFIAAMTGITGEFEKAIKETSKVLSIRGNVFPSTIEKVRLKGEMEDGEFVIGESNIVKDPRIIKRISLIPDNVKPLQDALDAIKEADAIVMGPGSLYTSILPNLVIEEISNTIYYSNAIKIYVCNVMTQPGETDLFLASDHVKALLNHSGKNIVEYVLMNDGIPSDDLREKYNKIGAELVKPDADRVKELGCIPITADLISQTNVVRHDHEKLAQTIFRLIYDKSFISR